MLLGEITPFHFGFYKKKLRKTEEMVELYKGDDLVRDVQVKKTISKYSKGLFISRRQDGNILMYDDKRCIKFKAEGVTCRSLESLFRRFTSCGHLDFVILNVERIFYSFSRLENYSVNLFVALLGTYPVEEAFERPSGILGDYKVLTREDPSTFSLTDLEDVEEQNSSHIMNFEEKKKDRLIKFYKREKSSLLDFFRTPKPTSSHTIRFGRREGGILNCIEKKIPSVDFTSPRGVEKFLTGLVEKVKESPTDFVEVDCDALIYILKTDKGLFLFSNVELQSHCHSFLRDYHEAFVQLLEKQKQ